MSCPNLDSNLYYYYSKLGHQSHPIGQSLIPLKPLQKNFNVVHKNCGAVHNKWYKHSTNLVDALSILTKYLLRGMSFQYFSQHILLNDRNVISQIKNSGDQIQSTRMRLRDFTLVLLRPSFKSHFLHSYL